MATTTTRLGLRKPASSDNVSVGTDLDNNFDTLDAVVGLTDCMSTTRPSGPFKNQLIRESDTGSYYVSNGTAPASGSWLPVVSTEGPTTVGPVGSAAPLRMQTISTLAGNRLIDARRQGESNPGFQCDFDGHMQFGPGGATATDTDLYRVSAGALGIKGGATLGCFTGTATSQVANPYAGQLFLNTTDNLLYRYTGSTWIPVVSTGATESGARYTNNGVGLPTVAASGGGSTVPFNNPQATSSYITASGTNNTVFTINRTGWCSYSSGVRWRNDVTLAAGGDWFYRAVLVAGSVELMGKTEKAPVAYGANTFFISTLTDMRYFNAGDQIQFSFANGTNQTATLVSAGELINCSFRWGGP